MSPHLMSASIRAQHSPDHGGELYQMAVMPSNVERTTPINTPPHLGLWSCIILHSPHIRIYDPFIDSNDVI